MNNRTSVEELSREYTLHEYLRRAAQDNSVGIKRKDWKRIGAEAEQLWPQLKPQLYAYGVHPSEVELRICWLIKMRLAPVEMAVVLNRSRSAISNIRSRLYTKIHGVKGTGRMLDEFIRGL